MSKIKHWSVNFPFSLYVDDYGEARGIALYGQVILHLEPGTFINKIFLVPFMKMLNALPKSAMIPIIVEKQKYEAQQQKHMQIASKAGL